MTQKLKKFWLINSPSLTSSGSAIKDSDATPSIGMLHGGVDDATCVYSQWLSTTYRPNSPRAASFYKLWRAIDLMRRMPEGHDMHVDTKVAEKAIQFLAKVNSNWEVDAPKLLPDNEEALTLTWDYGTIKRFLTVAADEFDLMDINKRSRVRCTHEVLDDESNSYEALLSKMGWLPRTESVDTLPNA